MDLKMLEYIVAIADHKSITKAANDLYISQSGLNQQLIKEEKELGIQLFHRSKKEILPTQAGKIYIENARRILKIAQNTYTQIHDLEQNPTGNIALGLPFEHGVDMLIDILPKFNQQYPHVTITMMEQTVSEMKNKITSDHLDMAFIMQNTPPDQTFDYIKLCSEKLVLGIPRRITAAQYAPQHGKPMRTLPLEYVKDENFAFMFAGSTMRQIIDPMFDKAGIHPNIHYETLMNNALFRLVNSGLCCTIIPQSYAQRTNSTAWFYLEDDPKWNWYFIYSKTRTLSVADKYLISLAIDYGHQMEIYWEQFGIGRPTILN